MGSQAWHLFREEGAGCLARALCPRRLHCSLCGSWMTRCRGWIEGHTLSPSGGLCSTYILRLSYWARFWPQPSA